MQARGGRKKIAVMMDLSIARNGTGVMMVRDDTRDAPGQSTAQDMSED